MNYLKMLLLLGVAVFMATGCQPNSESSHKQVHSTASHENSSTSVEVSNAWARPGSTNGNSAVYLQIYNGINTVDTLLSVKTEAAKKAGIHETFNKDGLSGMRPAGPQIIRPDSVLKLQPRGLHIMLMQLNRGLAEGDSIQLTLEFAAAGKRKISVPVKISN